MQRIRRSSETSDKGSSKQTTCTARTHCKAHKGASLDMSTHHCVGCGLKIHSAALCGMSLADVVVNYPEFIGFQLVGEQTIVHDDPDNEVRAVCFTCITVMNKRAKLIHRRKRIIYDDDDSDDEDNSNEIRDDVAIDEDAESIGTFTCDGPVDLRFSSLLAPNYSPMLQVPGEFM